MMTKEIDGKVYELDDAMIANYFDRMTGRIFKIIPIREEGEYRVQPYISSLLRELLGAQDLMNAIEQDERFMQIVSIMNYLSENPDIEQGIMKSEIFHVLNILKKINKAHTSPAKQPAPDDAPAEGA